ncbi:MAG: saccharopine dehydrogenase C-terminal domain-containing protein [Planctomycetota bacterium]
MRRTSAEPRRQFDLVVSVVIQNRSRTRARGRPFIGQQSCPDLSRGEGAANSTSLHDSAAGAESPRHVVIVRLQNVGFADIELPRSPRRNSPQLNPRRARLSGSPFERHRSHMERRIKTAAVIGIGKVGTLVATLLHEGGFKVIGHDSTARDDLGFPVFATDVADPAKLREVLKGRDAVVSCLPYHLNLGVAKAAFQAGVHYFDLTEDVPTTKAIIDMSAQAQRVMAPQCGLAPGFIGIVGASLTHGFEHVRSVELRVGALPQHPSGLLGYAFNWSPEGVVNEYLNDCEVIQDRRKMLVPPMEQLETIVVQGISLEAFTTSGGLGTMCDTFLGRVDELNYKTMRYHGHCELMRFFFRELHMKDNRKAAGEILVNAKPPVNDDVVFVHAAVEGRKQGDMFREEFVRAYFPKRIAGKMWRAISWTTAASVCAIVELVANGALPGQGFIKQEDILLSQFLGTRCGGYYHEE